MRLRILDIDGSLPVQPGMAEAIAARRAQCVNLRAEEFSLRLWSSGRRMRALQNQLTAAQLPPGSGPIATFYGSGDYHHLVSALVGSVAEPVSVVHFDNHPDWVRFPATHNCGGWVNRVLELPEVARVVTVGVCSDDLVSPQIKGANLAALGSGRLEIHPWLAAPSRVWGRIGNGSGHRQEGGNLVWNCVADLEWAPWIDALVARLPTEAVWVTIDKDVLRPADAATNWDQGKMPLDFLVSALARIGQCCRVVGVDICGEYSPPRFRNPVKRIAAWLDHPDDEPAPAEAIQRNDRTNRALVRAMSEFLP